MNASVKIRKQDSEGYYRALLQTSLFILVDDVEGDGGARLITVRPVEWLSQVDIVIEQPHRLAIKDFRKSENLEIMLRCGTYEKIEFAHEMARHTSLKVTELHERPWGGQFALFDDDKNVILISN